MYIRKLYYHCEYLQREISAKIPELPKLRVRQAVAFVSRLISANKGIKFSGPSVVPCQNSVASSWSSSKQRECPIVRKWFLQIWTVWVFSCRACRLVGVMLRRAARSLAFSLEFRHFLLFICGLSTISYNRDCDCWSPVLGKRCGLTSHHNVTEWH